MTREEVPLAIRERVLMIGLLVEADGWLSQAIVSRESQGDLGDLLKRIRKVTEPPQ